MPANAALLIGIQTAGGLHHVIIVQAASGCTPQMAALEPCGRRQGRLEERQRLPPRGAQPS